MPTITAGPACLTYCGRDMTAGQRQQNGSVATRYLAWLNTTGWAQWTDGMMFYLWSLGLVLCPSTHSNDLPHPGCLLIFLICRWGPVITSGTSKPAAQQHTRLVFQQTYQQGFPTRHAWTVESKIAARVSRHHQVWSECTPTVTYSGLYHVINLNF